MVRRLYLQPQISAARFDRGGDSARGLGRGVRRAHLVALVDLVRAAGLRAPCATPQAAGVAPEASSDRHGRVLRAVRPKRVVGVARGVGDGGVTSGVGGDNGRSRRGVTPEGGAVLAVHLGLVPVVLEDLRLRGVPGEDDVALGDGGDKPLLEVCLQHLCGARVALRGEVVVVDEACLALRDAGGQVPELVGVSFRHP